MRFLVLVLVIPLVCTFGQSTQQNSVAEPQTRLHGMLQVGEFFGPPGYGEDPAVDRLEHSYYLQMSVPLNEQPGFVSLPQEADNDAGSTYFVQLVIYANDQAEAKTFVGKEVTLVGTLMTAISGHHRTPVLLVVKSIHAFKKWK